MTHEKLLSELIEIKSYSGDEKNLRLYIQNWLGQRNIESFQQENNLIAHIEGVDRSRAFIFNSHMDTVVSDPRWNTDPWTPTQDGDKIIGLGASDMKSGLAASLLLAENLSANGKPPVDMWFTYVEKEEEDGTGTRKFIEWFENQGMLDKYKDIAAIFTEPNSLTEVEHGHRGNYFLIAESIGTSGHASRPAEAKGNLAVDKMFKFSRAFRKATEKWNEEFPNSYFNPAITGGEITSFNANTKAEEYLDPNDKKIKLRVVPGSVNKLPAACTATFDFRTTPETHPFIYERVKELAKKYGIKIEPLFEEAPAGFTDPSERIVQIAKTTQGNRHLVVSLASADLGFLTAKGIKSVILGPGEKNQCHMPNEFCYPAQIPEAVNVYKEIVEAWAK